MAVRGQLLERAGRTSDSAVAFEAAADSARHPREAQRLRRRAKDTGQLT